MAENKKSFIAYLDWGSTFDELDDKEAGKLIKLIFDYVRDKNPEPPNKLIKIAFESIKHDLKRDLKKWESYIEKQRLNGGKGGRPKEEKEPKETQKSQAFFKKPKKADNVNVNVNDNDNTGKKNDSGWNTKPTEADLSLELPELTEGAVIQQFRFTKDKVVTKKQISGLWAVFKAQNFTGENFYQSDKKVYSHFINWCKTQEIKDSEEKQFHNTPQLKRI